MNEEIILAGIETVKRFDFKVGNASLSFSFKTDDPEQLIKDIEDFDSLLSRAQVVLAGYKLTIKIKEQ